jgi:YebC/PmpR family DNA-binding regulatory protein
MAGHSKWNNIKNKKGAEDDKRAKIFGQISKQIRIAVKEGKSDNPNFNPMLRTILEKARSANMPKDNITRAINRGMGKSATGAAIQEITYEGFGPGGAPIIAVALTDNQNRTTSDIRYAFSRHGGSLGSPGSAMYMFERSQNGDYVPTIPMEISAEDQVQLRSLADALLEYEDVEDVYTVIPLDEE